MSAVAHDDGDAPDLVPVGVSMAEQAEIFRVKLQSLLDEALTYGFSGIALLCAYDPLSDVTSRTFAKRGNHYTVTGLMHDVVRQLEEQTE